MDLRNVAIIQFCLHKLKLDSQHLKTIGQQIKGKPCPTPTNQI